MFTSKSMTALLVLLLFQVIQLPLPAEADEKDLLVFFCHYKSERLREECLEAWRRCPHLQSLPECDEDAIEFLRACLSGDDQREHELLREHKQVWKRCDELTLSNSRGRSDAEGE